LAFWFLLPLSTLFRLPIGVIVDSRSRLPMSQLRIRNIQAFFLVFRVLSSTLLPCFLGPESSVLPVNLPPSVPYTLRVRLIALVLWYLWQLRYQYSRASLGKTHHLLISRPASHRFGSPDIRSCLATTARPPLQRHIAGLLFITYISSASCFLQTSHYWNCPCLVGVALPSGNGGRFIF
jgi:hypothetical protein